MRALVQIMAWRRPGDKPLSEPMMVSLLTHICVTRPQWVNSLRPSDAYICAITLGHHWLRWWIVAYGVTFWQCATLHFGSGLHLINQFSNYVPPYTFVCPSTTIRHFKVLTWIQRMGTGSQCSHKVDLSNLTFHKSMEMEHFTREYKTYDLWMLTTDGVIKAEFIVKFPGQLVYNTSARLSVACTSHGKCPWGILSSVSFANFHKIA